VFIGTSFGGVLGNKYPIAVEECGGWSFGTKKAASKKRKDC
jgi:hypothetical protein